MRMYNTDGRTYASSTVSRHFSTETYINLLGMRIIIHSASYTLFAFDLPCSNDTNS